MLFNKLTSCKLFAQKIILLYDYENYNQLDLLIFSFYFFLQNIKIKLVLQQPGAILVQTTMK